MKEKIEKVKEFIETAKKQNETLKKKLKKGLSKYKASQARRFIEVNDLYIEKLESIIG